MPRKLSITMTAVLVGIAVWAGIYVRNVRLMRERAARYQQELRSYTDVIPAGATRKQVEDDLRARGMQFVQESSSGDRTNAYSDSVKIGTEPAPWYCSHNNVYVEFAFDAGGEILNRTSNASDSDILRTIAITPRLEGCL